MEPGRGNGIDGQCLQSDRSKHLIEVRDKQRIENLAEAVIIEGLPRQTSLQEGQQPPFLQAGPDLVERVMSVQNR